MAAAEIGLEITFAGEGIDEKGLLSGVDTPLFISRVDEEYLDALRKRLVDSRHDGH